MEFFVCQRAGDTEAGELERVAWRAERGAA